jgi:hypothetical protein
MLFAPKCGEETRADLTERAKNGIERVTAAAREIAHQTTQKAIQAKHQVQSIQDGINAGVLAFHDARTLYRL